MEISLALEINHHANIKLPLKSARDQPLPRWPTCLLKLRPVIGSLPLTLRGMTPAHCFKFGFCLEFKCRRPRVKIFVPTRGRLSVQRSPPCMGSRLTSSQDGWQFRSLIRVSPKVLQSQVRREFTCRWVKKYRHCALRFQRARQVDVLGFTPGSASAVAAEPLLLWCLFSIGNFSLFCFHFFSGELAFSV